MSERNVSPERTHEQAGANLNEYLKHSVAGDPKTMAFCDLVNLEVIEFEINRLEAFHSTATIDMILSRSLVQAKIKERESEIPGYYAESRVFEILIHYLSRGHKVDSENQDYRNGSPEENMIFHLLGIKNAILKR
jgi:hypothetical protein